MSPLVDRSVTNQYNSRLAPILQKLPDPKIWVMSICTLVPKNLW